MQLHVDTSVNLLCVCGRQVTADILDAATHEGRSFSKLRSSEGDHMHPTQGWLTEFQ